MVKTKLGHPARSQHGFVITLATPVLGPEFADLADDIKNLLGMKDPLLDSLKQGNLYLTMLNEFRELELTREARFVCRPVHLHAAYEEKYMGPLLIVHPDSAAESIANLTNSPIIGFPLNHSQMAKPKGRNDPLYRWVEARVKDEYKRIATWDVSHESFPMELGCARKNPLSLSREWQLRPSIRQRV